MHPHRACSPGRSRRCPRVGGEGGRPGESGSRAERRSLVGRLPACFEHVDDRGQPAGRELREHGFGRCVGRCGSAGESLVVKTEQKQPWWITAGRWKPGRRRARRSEGRSHLFADQRVRQIDPPQDIFGTCAVAIPIPTLADRAGVQGRLGGKPNSPGVRSPQ